LARELAGSFDSTDDRGDVRIWAGARRLLRERAHFGLAAGASRRRRLYLATYYPGTTSSDAARIVTVENGHDAHVSVSIAGRPQR
jgi:hypothetical protein